MRASPGPMALKRKTILIGSSSLGRQPTIGARLNELDELRRVGRF